MKYTNKSVTKSSEIERSGEYSLRSIDKISTLRHHLDYVQYLQKKVRGIIEKERTSKAALTSKTPTLNEKYLKKKRLEKVEMKIPVFVPLSSIKKKKKLQPNFINKVLPSGEVIPIYSVGKPPPRYDPLVAVEKVVPNMSNGHYRDSVDATAHSNRNSFDDESFFYYHFFRESKGKEYASTNNENPQSYLTEAPIKKTARPITPIENPSLWVFRELEQEEKKIKPKRKWVIQRMNKYYEERIKKDFLPKISQNKSLEIKLNKEKKNFKPKSFEKVNIFKDC